MRANTAQFPKNGTYWSEEEIAFLRDHYGKKRTKWIAKKLSRSYQSISIQASRLDLPYQHFYSIKSRTTMAWSKMLGINDKTFLMYLTRGDIKPGKHDTVNTHRYTFDPETIVNWIRDGNAIRCIVNEHTPKYLAQLIQEEKEKWINNDQLIAIDPWLNPDVFNRTGAGLYPMPKMKILIYKDKVHGIQSFYLKSEVYDAVYNCCVNIPLSIKDPYINAVRIAWESKYIRAYELRQYYIAKKYQNHPKIIKRRAYVRAEIVEWVKTIPKLAHLAKVLHQDEVTYQELHQNIEWRKKNNQLAF